MREVRKPVTKFLKVTCSKCKNEQIIFNKSTTDVKCLVCGTKLAEPKPPVRLSVTNDYVNETIVGSTTEIGIFVSNYGETSAKNVSIVENIPSGLMYHLYLEMECIILQQILLCGI